jgi:serine/threonine-protein kinase
VHQVGAGVLGPVFRAYDPEADRAVAVKSFPLDITPEQARELATELERLVGPGLTHPSIITPLAAGVDGATAYLVEQFFVAESLDVALKQYGPAPVPDTLRLVGQLAAALDFASAAGVHHGAIHPRDILVAPHEVRLTGLGVVGALERIGYRPSVRRPYAAPERRDPRTWGTPADIFSLACIAFELLTGRRPSATGGLQAPDVEAITAADHVALTEVFARALSVTPEDRFPTALAFAAALKHALTGEPLQPAPVPDTAPVAEPVVVATSDSGLPDDLQLAAPIGSDRGEDEIAAAMKRADDVPARPPREPLDLTKADRPSKPDRKRRPPSPTPLPIYLDTQFPEPEPTVRMGPVSYAPPMAAAPAVPESPVEPAAPVAAEPADQPTVVAVPTMGSPARPTDLPPLELRPPAAPEPRVSTVDDPFSVPETPPMDPRPTGSESSRSPMPIGALAATLVVGILLGSVGGYLFGTRTHSRPSVTSSPANVPAATVAAGGRAASTPATPVPAEPPAPTAASGAVATTPRPVGPGSPATASTATTAAPARAQPNQLSALERRRQARLLARKNAAERAAVNAEPRAVAKQPSARTQTFEGPLDIVSRPPGAQVMLDGHPVGTTPLALKAVTAGSHAVRLELPGYGVWSASVRVVAGAKTRVTASLEQRRPGG